MSYIFEHLTPDYIDDSVKLKVWKFNSVWESIGGYGQQLNENGQVITTNDLACNYGDVNSLDYWEIDGQGVITCRPAKHSVPYACAFFTTRGFNRYSSMSPNNEGLINADLELNSNFGYNNAFQMNLQLRESTTLPSDLRTDISSFFQFDYMTKVAFSCNGSYFSNFGSTIQPGVLEIYDGITEPWGAYHEYYNPVTWVQGVSANYLFMTYNTGTQIDTPARKISQVSFCRPIFYTESKRFYYYIDPLEAKPSYTLNFNRSTLTLTNVSVNKTYNFMLGILPDMFQISESLISDFYDPISPATSYTLYYMPLSGGGYKFVRIKQKENGSYAFYDVDEKIIVNFDIKKPGLKILYYYSGENGRFVIEPVYSLYSCISLILSSGCLYQTVASDFNLPINSGGSKIINNTPVFYSNFIQSKTDDNGINTGYDWINLYKDSEKYQDIANIGDIKITPPGEIDDPDTPDIVQNEDVGNTPFSTMPTFYLGSLGVNMYAVSQTGLNNVHTNLFGNTDADFLATLKAWNESASDTIRSLMLFPFSIPSYTPCVAGNIVCHGVELTSDAYVLRGSYATIDAGTIGFANSNRFTDYEPYTSCYLYLPYIGFTNLSTKDVYGHNLHIVYQVDINSGNCTASIARSTPQGEVIIKAMQSQMGVTLPITSRNYGEILSGMIGVGKQTASVAGSIAGTVSSGLIPGAGEIGGVPELSSNIISLDRNTMTESGSIMSVANMIEPQMPYIILSKNKADIPASYGHTVGFVTNSTYTLKNLSGFTVIANPDLTGISATNTELEMIKELLKTGIYL